MFHIIAADEDETACLVDFIILSDAKACAFAAAHAAGEKFVNQDRDDQCGDHDKGHDNDIEIRL